MVWQNVIVALIGIWFIIAPSVLGFAADMAMTWTSVIGGVILLILGASAALSEAARRQSWIQVVNALVGIWFIIAPWVLNFTRQAPVFWTSLILGIVTLILSLWDLQLMPSAAVSERQTR